MADAKFSFPVPKPRTPQAPLPVFVGSGSELETITREAVKGIIQIVGLNSVGFTMQQQLLAYALGVAEGRPEAEQVYLVPLINQLALSNNAGVVDVVEQAAERIRALGSAEAALMPTEQRAGFFQRLWSGDDAPPKQGVRDA